MREIEYFYSAHSAFAYLDSARFMAIAAQANRVVAHKPYELTRGSPALAPPPCAQGRTIIEPITSAEKSNAGPNTGTRR